MVRPSFPTEEEHKAYESGYFRGHCKGFSHHRRLLIQLFDALENIMSELFADGPTGRGKSRANRALANFEKRVGERHDGKWRQK